MNESDRRFCAFAWKTVCAHLWLQKTVSRLAWRAGVNPAVELMEAEAHELSRAAGETDPFLAEPEDIDFGIPGTAAGESWLALGLSALLIELALRRAGAESVADAKFGRSLSEMADRFELERRSALSEAGRLARQTPDGAARLREAVGRFRIPAERVWGDAYLEEARAAIEDRVSRSAVASDLIGAFNAVPELKGDLWPMLEPHLERHAKLFGIGRIKKGLIRAAVAAAQLIIR